MIDVFLCRHLLKAIESTTTRILFVLDPKQLPSVGAGNFGFDIIESGLLPITFLTQIFRYGEGGLMQVATKIRNGEIYADKDMKGIHNFGVNQDYSLISVEQEKSMRYVANIFSTLIQKGVPLDEIIILTAMNKGDYGTVNINKVIQQVINPSAFEKNELKYGDTIYREGDRVIQTKNNYRAKDVDGMQVAIFNGNIGTIVEIEGKTMIVSFDDRLIVYKNGDFDNLSLGYCITIHKSQGSAFKHVILLNPKSHTFFLSRNLLYVGVTRAKERVYHITTPHVISQALRQEATIQRNTFLKDLMNKIKKALTIIN